MLKVGAVQRSKRKGHPLAWPRLKEEEKALTKKASPLIANIKVAAIYDFARSILPSPGKFVFASLICNFRHGREEDEVMGVSFRKELVVDRVQVYPPQESKEEKTKMQVNDV